MSGTGLFYGQNHDFWCRDICSWRSFGLDCDRKEY
jgi:hypothetical protein